MWIERIEKFLKFQRVILDMNFRTQFLPGAQTVHDDITFKLYVLDFVQDLKFMPRVN